jgi:lipoprotein-anchoring transpeptidase ErfK/SrfK
MWMVWYRRSGISLLLGGLLALAAAAACRSGGDGWNGATQSVAAVDSSPAPALSLVVDLSERRLYVYESGALTHTYVVSVGMPKHRTPVGKYRIGHLVWNPWWIPPRAEWTRGKKPTPPGPNNPMGRVKMYFAPKYYIHGTPETETLGEPVSHGCIRMYEQDAIALARLVLQKGGSKVSSSEIDRILAEPSHTVTMPVPAPIPLEVRG